MEIQIRFTFTSNNLSYVTDGVYHGSFCCLIFNDLRPMASYSRSVSEIVKRQFVSYRVQGT
jgi:hypothetical protein